MASIKYHRQLMVTLVLFLLVGWNLFIFPSVVFSKILVECGIPSWMESTPDVLPWFPASLALVWVTINRFRLGLDYWLVIALSVACSMPILAMTGGGLVIASLAAFISGLITSTHYRLQKDYLKGFVCAGLGVTAGMAVLAIFPVPLLHTGTLLVAEYFEKGVCR